jgi:DNA-binding CsgD family transcriptional regulator
VAATGLLILSPREKQLLRRIALGKTDHNISKEIGGTDSQVAAQRQALIKKLHIQSDAQLKAAVNQFAPWPSQRRGEDGGTDRRPKLRLDQY